MSEQKTNHGCYIGNSWPVKEKFSWKKALNGFFNILNPVEWAKSLKEILDLRKLIIYALIVGTIFGWGYMRGLDNRPIKLDLKSGKAYTFRVDDDRYMHINEAGIITIQDDKGNVLRTLKVKDVDGLNKLLRPYGLQLRPAIYGGMSAGKDGKPQGEVGVGVAWFKAWKMEIDSFITTHPALYTGVSYMLTEDLGIGVAGGMGFRRIEERDLRALLYVKFKF